MTKGKVGEKKEMVFRRMIWEWERNKESKVLSDRV